MSPTITNDYLRLSLSLISLSLLSVIWTQTCDCHPSNQSLAQTLELIGAIDAAKNTATSCRFLVNYSNNLDSYRPEQLRTLQLSIPKTIEKCYAFIDSILRRRLNQLGLGNLAYIGHTLFQTESESKSKAAGTSSSSPLTPSRLLPDIGNIEIPKTMNIADFEDQLIFLRRADFLKRILKEGFAKGADYCTFITTGVLADIINFVQNYLFRPTHIIKTLNPYIPATSPLASIESLGRYNPNSLLRNLLLVNEKCKQFKAESHLLTPASSHMQIEIGDKIAPTHYLSPEYALDALGPNPSCEKFNVFVLTRLHSIKDDHILERLTQASNNLLTACLENLAQTKERLNVMQQPLEMQQKVFSRELILYLGNKFVAPTNSNIIDKMNPRSLINNNIEHDLFFQAQTQLKFSEQGLNPIRIYESGRDICDVIETYEFFSPNVKNGDLSSSMEMLHILLSINDLELDLTQFQDNEQLQFVLLWYICQDLRLYQLNLKNPKNGIEMGFFSLSDLPSTSFP